MLDSEDTAIVVVEGVLPAGATEGTTFDVRVYADPRTGTSSLEGGRLYTTDLRPGALTAGGQQAFALAEARGPIFVNPFAEPGAGGRDSINRLSGRILAGPDQGGRSLDENPVKLRLATPSHQRAASIQTTINSLYPTEPTQRDKTAHGQSGDLIKITVPPSYAKKTREFINLLRHTTLRLDAAETTALRIGKYLEANPSAAFEASWRWQALGERVLPVVKDYYDYPEERPRLAALRAGAKLNDPAVAPHLIEMARSASPDTREQSVALLADMGFNPLIGHALRELLNDEDVAIRLAAYEALAKRYDPAIERIFVDRKFEVHVVPSDKPLIYVSQFGSPQVAIFGDLEIERPLTFSAWSNRLMVKADAGDDEVEVFFRSLDGGTSIQMASADAAAFAYFLGHEKTIEQPAAGIGLTYGESVGALYQLWRQGFLTCDFKSEQDRILAAILATEREARVEDRPEFGGEAGGPDAPLTDPSDLDRLGDLEPPAADDAVIVPR
jgi:hypothetical protein